MKYPSVTTVVGLHSKETNQTMARELVKKANKITKRATKRGTSFHQHVEDYLRKEKDFIEFDNILQEQMFKTVQPVLDDIIPIARSTFIFS